MKVLMFGWEFPPHISGGLGTACFGLTHALLEEQVEVLFVVPRLFGDESGMNSFLISASQVSRERMIRRGGAPRASHARRVTLKKASTAARENRSAMTYLEVPALLSPYQVQSYETAGTRSVQGALTRWNYSMSTESSSMSTESSPDQHTLESNEKSAYYVDNDEVDNDEPFQFSGTYGRNLMEEVRRYADVAEALTDKHTFDVIHVHDWMTMLAGVAAKRRSKKPLIVHVHSTEFDRSGEVANPEVLEIERFGFAEADRIITVSNWTKKIVLSRYGVAEEKITVVHNGITPKEEATEFDFPEIGSHFITFLGRVTHQKGPSFFVEAAKEVLREFPEAHFIVAGAGDLLPQIIERVAELNLSANFHFTGFLSGDQVDKIWSLTDVYVMPSVSEPFGIAPLEAIQGNVPVILSKQSGVAEVMPHAIKVDFWKTRELAAAICSVLRYESLSSVLRQKGKQHIKNLTWDKAAVEVKGVYYELFNRE